MYVATYCGSLELEVNFMKTYIVVSDPYKIQNITVADALDDNNGLVLTLAGTGGVDPLTVNATFCSRKIFFEVCTMEEQEDVQVRVVQLPQICYLTRDQEQDQEM